MCLSSIWKRSEETLGDAINIAELQRLDGLPSNVLAIQTFIVIPASADLKSATLPNRIIWDLKKLYSKEVLGKFCRHFPWVKPIPLAKERNTKQLREDWAYHHPVHALLSRNIDLKRPETYLRHRRHLEKEICLEMEIQIIEPLGAEPTFIRDYGPQFCGLEMVP